MKNIFFLLALLVFSACLSTNKELNVDTPNPELTDGKEASLETSNIEDDLYVEHEDIIGRHTTEKASPEALSIRSFVVVADTGVDYEKLNQRMMELNKKTSIPVDMMGRNYDKNKDLISVPESDPDKYYAGKYFPRRYPSENLSLEYLKFYKNDVDVNTIALVTGIYKSKEQAQKAISKMNIDAFIVESEVNIGGN